MFHRLHTLALCLFVTLTSALSAVSGILPNGLHYIVEEVHEKRGEVAARMHIAVGHLDEEPGQEGYAHLLEHVVFDHNDTFECGALGGHLHAHASKHGIRTNAYTSLISTVYQMDVNLREGAKLIDTLTFFRSILAGDSCSESIVQREGRIILEELRMRDTLESRQLAASFFVGLFGSSVVAADYWDETVPENTLRATGESLQRFRSEHYGTARATLVIAGDFDANVVARQIAETFGGLENTASPRKRPHLAETASVVPTAVVSEPYYASAKVQFSLTDLGNEHLTSAEELARDANIVAVREVLKERMRKALVIEPRLFLSPSESGKFVDGVWSMNVALVGPSDDWQHPVRQLISSIKDLVVNPITDAEIQLFSEVVDSEFADEDEDDADFSAVEVCEQYVALISQESEFATPAAEREAARAAFQSVTASSANAFLAAVLHNLHRSLVLLLPEDAPAPTADELQEFVDQVWKEPSHSESQASELEELREHILYNTEFAAATDAWHELAKIQYDNMSLHAGENILLSYATAKTSDNDEESDAAATVLAILELGAEAERPATAFAIILLNLEIDRLNAAFAEDSVKISSTLLPGKLILNISAPQESTHIAAAVLRYLVTDFQIDPVRFAAVKDIKSREFWITTQYELMPVAVDHLLHALGAPSLNEKITAVMGLSEQEVQVQLSKILKQTPLFVRLDSELSSEESVAMLVGIFGDSLERQKFDDVTETASGLVVDKEMVLSIKGTQAVAMVAFPLPDCSQMTQALMESIVRSRMLERLRYSEAKTYTIYTASLRGHLAVWVVCHADNAEQIQTMMIEECTSMTGDRAPSYDEYVGLAIQNGEPSWKFVKRVQDVEEAFAWVADQHPVVKLRIRAQS